MVRKITIMKSLNIGQISFMYDVALLIMAYR